MLHKNKHKKGQHKIPNLETKWLEKKSLENTYYHGLALSDSQWYYDIDLTWQEGLNLNQMLMILKYNYISKSELSFK